MHFPRGLVVTAAFVILFILITEGLLIWMLLRRMNVYEDTVEDVKDDEDARKPIDGNHYNSYEQAPADPSKPWTNIRLPRNLIPITYDISLRPVLDMDKTGRYSSWGSSIVTFKCDEPTRFVILHSRVLFNSSHVTLTMEGVDVKIVDIMFFPRHDYVIFEIEEKCRDGKFYTLTLSKFVTVLSHGLFGLYRSEYRETNGSNRIVISSQMQPTGARMVFPCFDEPFFKAKFTVTMWYKANSTATVLSNTPAKFYKAKMIEDELWNSTTFEQTVTMSTYTLAVAMADYSYVSRVSESGIQMKTYASEEAILGGAAEYSSRIAPKMLDFFQDYFNFKYPLTKLDQIAIPRLAFGAMENWGLVTYGFSQLLLKKNPVALDEMTTTIIVAHELSHQWIGNLVTPEWWNEVWLNEGFATYFSYIGESAVHPTWKSMSKFLLEFYDAMKEDQLEDSHPLIQDVHTPDEIWALFDTITYSKGASVLRMTHGFLGDTFKDGLRAYVKDLAYGTTTSEKLYKYWEPIHLGKSGLPAPVREILTTWTTQVGYPMLNVRKDAKRNLYTVTQEHIAPEFTNRTAYDRSGWYIPFTYKLVEDNKASETSLEWVLPTGEVTVTGAKVILANVDAIGYYRVNYDEHTWWQLTKLLKSDEFQVISDANRVQLISDAFTMAKSGHLDILVAFDLSEYLIRETEYVPWRIFLNEVEYVGQMLERSPAYEDFSKYLLQIAGPMYEANGWLDESAMGDSDVLERMMIGLAVETACRYESNDCIQQARLRYRAWMESDGEKSSIDVPLRKDVYCTAIRHGGLLEWNFAWEMYHRAKDSQERDRLMYALSCSEDAWVLQRYLAFCLRRGTTEGQQDWITCLSQVALQKSGTLIAWSFLADNYKSMLERRMNIIPFLKLFAERFSTDYELNLLKEFPRQVSEAGISLPDLSGIVALTEKMIKWREDNEKKLSNWLRRRVKREAWLP